MSGDRRLGLLYWAAALVTLIVLRVPYLTSPAYILDNDEAVLAIMARHFAAGEGIPLYFAGQNYGLAIFEALPLGIAFRLFYESDTVVALTMLALFCMGVVAYTHALGHLAGDRAWGRSLALVLAMLPGWIVWSMKARGIYVSGFVLSGLALALLARPDPSRISLLMAGFLLGLVGLVQPLWLTVAAPFLLLVRRPPREVATAGLLTTGVWLLAWVFGPQGEAFWQPRPLEGLMLERLRFAPQVLLRAFSGRVAPNEPGLTSTLIGVGSVLAYFSLMAGTAWQAVRHRSRAALLVSVAMCASVLVILVMRVWVPRYFLPCSVLAIVAGALWIRERGVQFAGVPRLATIGLLVLLAAAATRVGRASSSSTLAAVPARDDIRTLIESLERDGVRGVYAQSPDVQWQILYYGNERIPARGLRREDRYPRFPAAVAEAWRDGAPTAYVANIRQLRGDVPTDSFPGYRVGERYLRLDDPDAALLFAMGFVVDPRSE